MTTPRERRQQRLEEQRRKELPSRIAKGALWPVIIVLALAGIGTAVYFANQAVDDCPGHWHATVGVFVQDDRLAFPQPPYNLAQEGGKLPLSMHMHRGDQELLHFEPGSPRCRGFQDTLGLLDVELESGRLDIGGGHEGGPLAGTYRNNETHTVRVHIQMAGEDMREVGVRSVLDYQLKDGEKVVVTYGNHTEEQIQGFLNTLAWPPGYDQTGRLF